MDEHGAGLCVLDGQRGRPTSLYLEIVGRTVQQIPLCGFNLGGGVPAVRKLRERDNAVAVRGISADALAVHLGDLKLHTLDALAAVRVHLDDLTAADRRVGKGQCLRVVSVNLDGLRGAVQHITVRRFYLRYHIGIRFKVYQLDLAVAVRGVNAVGSDCAAVVSNKRAVRGRDLELCAGKWLLGYAVDLVDDKIAVFAVGKLYCHHILLLTGEIDGLRRVVDLIAYGSLGFLYDVGPGLQPGDHDGAVGRGGVFSDDRAASAGGSAQIAYTELCTLQHGTAVCVHLFDDERRERCVLKGQRLAGACLNEAVLCSRVFDGVTRCRFHFGHAIPAVAQLCEFDLTVFIGEIGAEVVQFSGEAVVAGIGDVELCALDGVFRDAVHLVDGQRGLGIIAETHRARFVGNEGDGLRFAIQQITVRHTGFTHHIHTGVKGGEQSLAVGVGLDGGERTAVCLIYGEGHTRDRCAGHSVSLYDFEVGLLLVIHHQRAVLAGKQLCMVFRVVQHIAAGRCDLLDRVHARFQIRDGDAPVGVGHAVKVLAAVLDLCDPKGCTGKIAVVLRVVFHYGQNRLLRVGEHETGIFSGVDLDNTLIIVHQIAIRCGDLLHGVRARLERRQVDLAVFVGHILLGESAAHQRNAKLDIGQRLHRAAVHLDDVDTGLDGVEEGQCFDTAACGQLNLLRRAVQHIACTGGNLLYQIGSRLEVGQADLSHLVRGERADEDSIAGNFKGHIGQNFVGLLIIFGDDKTRFGLIFQHKTGFRAGSHIHGVGLVVLHETAGCRHLAHLICTGLQLVEVHAAAEISFSGLRNTAFNMLDLHRCPCERSATVRVDLVHAQIAVGCVFKGDSRGIAVVHGNGLGSFRAQKVPLGRCFLCNDILAGEGQRNNDLAAGIRDKAAEDRPIRCLYLESCARKGRIRSGFYLFDDKGSFCGRFRFVWGIRRRRRIAAEGRLADFRRRIGVAHIALEGAILAGFRA